MKLNTEKEELTLPPPPWSPYAISRIPRIEFGSGVLKRLPDIAKQFGSRALLVTGARSLPESSHWEPLCQSLRAAGVEFEQASFSGEPTVENIDQAVAQFKDDHIDVVIGIGGGSALDAAKALAGLLPVADSVMDYLEGVGPEKTYTGPALPCISVPTTAGTGSEATKNAVISRHGEDGFKKSFRDVQLVPEYAIVDPDLLESCPRPQIAANAMDALTQLLESYFSLRANPYTDSLVEGALAGLRDGLFHWYDNTDHAAAGRERLAHAALVSGICLAQTGLGAVHGLASPLGAFFPMPHGVVCGTLLASVTHANLLALKDRDPDNPVREKFARTGRILANRKLKNPRNARESLFRTLGDWSERMELPRLNQYEMTESDIPKVVAHSRGSSMKTNPIVLTDEELTNILMERL